MKIETCFGCAVLLAVYAIVITALAYVGMLLWNYVIPQMFGAPKSISGFHSPD